MTQDQFRNLKRGDLVRNKFVEHEIWLVAGNYDGHVTAVGSANLRNPAEWELLPKAEPPTITRTTRKIATYELDVTDHLAQGKPAPDFLHIGNTYLRRVRFEDREE